jgi:hypothetical protein
VTIKQNVTRAALVLAAPEAGALQPEIVAQNVDERRIAVGVDLDGSTVDGHLESFGHGSGP